MKRAKRDHSHRWVHPTSYVVIHSVSVLLIAFSWWYTRTLWSGWRVVVPLLAAAIPTYRLIAALRSEVRIENHTLVHRSIRGRETVVPLDTIDKAVMTGFRAFGTIELLRGGSIIYSFRWPYPAGEAIQRCVNEFKERAA